MSRLDDTAVLTLGTFDLVHFGHVEFLQECSKLGSLTVGINTDEFVATFKERPAMTTREREHAVGLLGYRTVINESAGRELIEDEMPDILVIGSDWARKNYLKQIDVTQDWLDNNHIILAYIPYMQTYPISSTELKRRIRGA